jgi:hypothetical protein
VIKCQGEELKQRVDIKEGAKKKEQLNVQSHYEGYRCEKSWWQKQ